MLEADPHIIRTAATGDHRAFEIIVRTYQEPVVRFLAHLLSDRVLADDVAQETFLRCYQKLDHYSFEGRFSTWLLRVAHNAGIDAIRSRVRRERLDGAGTIVSATDPVLRAELVAALGTLPVRLREPLLLVEVTGLRYREAAEVLGIPEGTVKSRVAHARSRLARWFRAGDESRPGAGERSGRNDVEAPYRDERGRDDGKGASGAVS
ncbi:MAG TPA: sigma-70 family RNA polymerase sigma factor [Acidimicrobiia bacterium]|nr:sigma-70 family RNA polymerase sigma factor [Acidimicrobiia bacterium]